MNYDDYKLDSDIKEETKECYFCGCSFTPEEDENYCCGPCWGADCGDDGY
jgi:hypothetical protein